VSDNMFAKQPLRCSDGRLRILTDTALDAAGKPTNTAWTPLSVGPYDFDAGLRYLAEEDDAPTLFQHYINGAKQDGFYLGGFNTSTWGVQWQRSAGPVSYNQPYYSLRLLPEGQALKPNETKSFLKIFA
jgi:hypothetical protein